MNSFWVLMAFWMGGCAGFLLFALMQIARDATDERRREAEPLSFISNDPGG
jgi:hypothetical protein